MDQMRDSSLSSAEERVMVTRNRDDFITLLIFSNQNVNELFRMFENVGGEQRDRSPFS
jgi:hypothetical protein